MPLSKSLDAPHLELKPDQYLVLGNPIAHSRSPQIHLAFARQTLQAMVYGLRLVELDQFTATIEALRQDPSFRGCNVTVPFKLEALSYAQLHGAKISPRAQLAGAVNTLKFEDGSMFADNTDGVGLVNDILHRQKLRLQDASMVLLGAGGAARGVMLPLLDAGVRQIVVANRSVDKAQILVESVRHLAPEYRQKVVFSSLSEALTYAPDVLLNATSSALFEHGQTKKESLTDLLSVGLNVGDKPLANLKLAYDMVYGSKPSQFMVWAKENACQKVCDGLGMLVEQAAESFNLWRGVRPAADPVFNELRTLLMVPVQSTKAT